MKHEKIKETKNMNGIIIYKSKYDSTKQFSKWLKDDTGFDLFEVSNVPSILNNYECS